MAASEADTKKDSEAASLRADSSSLANFLTPPSARAKSSMPPAPEAVNVPAVSATEAIESTLSKPEGAAFFTEELVPRTRRHSSMLPGPRGSVRPSSAPAPLAVEATAAVHANDVSASHEAAASVEGDESLVSRGENLVPRFRERRDPGRSAPEVPWGWGPVPGLPRRGGGEASGDEVIVPGGEAASARSAGLAKVGQDFGQAALGGEVLERDRPLDWDDESEDEYEYEAAEEEEAEANEARPGDNDEKADGNPGDEEDEDEEDEDEEDEDEEDEDEEEAELHTAAPRANGVDAKESVDGNPLDDDPFTAVPSLAPPWTRPRVRTALYAGAAFVAIVALLGVFRGRATRRASAVPAVSADPRTQIVGGDPRPDDLDTDLAADGVEPALSINPAMGKALAREARAQLEGGHIDQGIATARRAIEADPEGADGYVLLAAGLQDLGQWQEARAIFERCVQRSSAGANSECAYFATKGK